MGETKERLDVLLVEKGFFETREKAKRNIMAGIVFVNNARIDKAGEFINRDSIIEVKGDAIPYVSRGGLKLEKAISKFDLKLEGLIAMDVGASTGGFTDCMLKNGAVKVYSVDVGYGQLAWELRIDSRVKCMERTNIRYVKPEDLDEPVDFASIDVAFISLRLVLPVVRTLLCSDGEVVALIKPQFEAGRDKVGKKGVVRDQQTHFEVVSSILSFSLSAGFSIKGLTFSPIKGPEGNIEYLVYLKKSDSPECFSDINAIAKNIVEKSHENL